MVKEGGCGGNYRTEKKAPIAKEKAVLNLFNSNKDIYATDGIYIGHDHTIEEVIELLKWAKDKENLKKVGYLFWHSHGHLLPYSIKPTQFFNASNVMNEMLFDTFSYHLDHYKKNPLALLQRISDEDKSKLSQHASKLPPLIDEHQYLISGEWLNYALSKAIIKQRMDIPAFHARVKWGQTLWGQTETDRTKIRHDPFFLGDFFKARENEKINFYRRSEATEKDNYLAALYSISHRLVYDPQSKTDSGTNVIPSLYFCPEFFRVLDWEQEAIKKYCKTKEGKELLKKQKASSHENPLTLIIEGKAQYQGTSTVALNALFRFLNEQWREEPLTDARYALIVCMFTTPSDLSVQERADIVFGDHSLDTLEKMNDLLQFHHKNMYNTARFLFANKLKPYLINRSSKETEDFADLFLAVNNMQDTPDSVKIPEVLLIEAREYKANKIHAFTPYEAFLKKHDREIMEIRFGDNSIVDRNVFIQALPEMLEQCRSIFKTEWSISLQQEIQKIINEQKPKQPKPRSGGTFIIQ